MQMFKSRTTTTAFVLEHSGASLFVVVTVPEVGDRNSKVETKLTVGGVDYVLNEAEADAISKALEG